jgi:hypothetical protein
VDPTGAPEKFKTVIARARPSPDEELPQPRRYLTKLYALDGTTFFDKLGGSTVDFDVIGIYTLDPLSVIKALDKAVGPLAEEWVEVQYPLAFIVFGLMPEE